MKKLLGLLAVAPMALAACGGSDEAKALTAKEVFEANISTDFAVQGTGDADTATHLNITQELIDGAVEIDLIKHNMGLAVMETAADVFLAMVTYDNVEDAKFKHTLLFEFDDESTITNYAATSVDFATGTSHGKEAALTEMQSWTKISEETAFDKISGATHTTDAVNGVLDALKSAWTTVKPADAA